MREEGTDSSTATVDSRPIDDDFERYVSDVRTRGEAESKGEKLPGPADEHERGSNCSDRVHFEIIRSHARYRVSNENQTTITDGKTSIDARYA